MVHFKITDGSQTRRFQASPGELTFEQLKEKIASLFPESVKDTTNLTLRYRDAEGDVITLSSNQEFQEVLSDLPQDHVWKLHITPPQQRQARPRSSQFERHLQEVEQLVDLFFGHLNSPQPEGKNAKSSKENDTAAPSTSEKGQEGENTDNTTPGTTESQPSSDTAPEEGGEEEVKSKLSGDAKKESGSESSSPQCPAGHCHLRVKRVGLWEPLFGGLFGPSLLSPAVGYHITWSPRSPAFSKSSAAATA